MAGTKEGGKKAAATNRSRYGDQFYKIIGRAGGIVSHPETRPFSMNQRLAKEAGRKGVASRIEMYNSRRISNGKSS